MLTLLHLPGCKMPSGLNQMCHDLTFKMTFFWQHGTIYKYNTNLQSWYKVVGTVVHSTSCRCGATLRLVFIVLFLATWKAYVQYSLFLYLYFWAQAARK